MSSHVPFTELKKPSQTLLERIEMQRGNEKLDLTVCSIEEIPLPAIISYFGRPPNMDLDLSHNYISYIRQDFAIHLKHLTKLDLSRNRIRKLPDNFGELKKLVYLDLHQNLLETLPLSMGNMTRLTYLSISENPLRDPLKNVLGRVGTNVSGLAMAEMIVSFLQEVSNASDVPPTHSSQFPLRSRRSSKIHYSRRSSTVTYDQVKESSSSGEMETDEDFNRRVNKHVNKMTPFQSFTYGIGMVFLLLVLWLFLVPLFIAYVVDTSYLMNLANTSPTFAKIWKDFHYENLHGAAVKVVNLLPRNSAWVLQGPPEIVSKGRTLGFVGRVLGIPAYILYAIRSMFGLARG